MVDNTNNDIYKNFIINPIGYNNTDNYINYLTSNINMDSLYSNTSYNYTYNTNYNYTNNKFNNNKLNNNKLNTNKILLDFHNKYNYKLHNSEYKRIHSHGYTNYDNFKYNMTLTGVNIVNLRDFISNDIILNYVLDINLFKQIYYYNESDKILANTDKIYFVSNPDYVPYFSELINILDKDISKLFKNKSNNDIFGKFSFNNFNNFNKSSECISEKRLNKLKSLYKNNFQFSNKNTFQLLNTLNDLLTFNHQNNLLLTLDINDIVNTITEKIINNPKVEKYFINLLNNEEFDKIFTKQEKYNLFLKNYFSHKQYLINKFTEFIKKELIITNVKILLEDISLLLYLSSLNINIDKFLNKTSSNEELLVINNYFNFKNSDSKIPYYLFNTIVNIENNCFNFKNNLLLNEIISELRHNSSFVDINFKNNINYICQNYNFDYKNNSINTIINSNKNYNYYVLSSNKNFNLICLDKFNFIIKFYKTIMGVDKFTNISNYSNLMKNYTYLITSNLFKTDEIKTNFMNIYNNVFTYINCYNPLDLIKSIPTHYLVFLNNNIFYNVKKYANIINDYYTGNVDITNFINLTKLILNKELDYNKRKSLIDIRVKSFYENKNKLLLTKNIATSIKLYNYFRQELDDTNRFTNKIIGLNLDKNYDMYIYSNILNILTSNKDFNTTKLKVLSNNSSEININNNILVDKQFTSVLNKLITKQPNDLLYNNSNNSNNTFTNITTYYELLNYISNKSYELDNFNYNTITLKNSYNNLNYKVINVSNTTFEKNYKLLEQSIDNSSRKYLFDIFMRLKLFDLVLEGSTSTINIYCCYSLTSNKFNFVINKFVEYCKKYKINSVKKINKLNKYFLKYNCDKTIRLNMSQYNKKLLDNTYVLNSENINKYTDFNTNKNFEKYYNYVLDKYSKNKTGKNNLQNKLQNKINFQNKSSSNTSNNSLKNIPKLSSVIQSNNLNSKSDMSNKMIEDMNKTFKLLTKTGMFNIPLFDPNTFNSKSNSFTDKSCSSCSSCNNNNKVNELNQPNGSNNSSNNKEYDDCDIIEINNDLFINNEYNVLRNNFETCF